MEENLNVVTTPLETTATETTNTNVDSTNAENTTQTDTTTADNGYKLKVKYNHEEMEIPESEAINYVQKGLNYEKAVERAKQEAYQESSQKARDAMIAEFGYEWMGKPITTEAEYKQALSEQEVYSKLQNQNLPDEVINEILEGKRFREKVLTQEQQAQQQAKKQQEYSEFFEYFASENGRSFDPAKDVIPDEVWHETNKGKTLIDAYRANEVKSLKAKLKEFESKVNAQQVNMQNANNSTGSVTGNGANNVDFISVETFEANKHDRNWVVKNFEKINKSRAKW